MVKLTKIYTKTGDGGTTRLVNGDEVAKFDARVEAYGAVDETNAALGLARAGLGQDGGDMACDDLRRDEMALDGVLKRIQNDLFDVGADLATPGPDEGLDYVPLRMVQGPIDWLEGRIDALNGDLEPLTSFILPAGSEMAARLHLARTTCRRAERRVAKLLAEQPDTTNALAGVYLNRLSDLLFVAARWIDRANGDALWVPGENR